MHVSIAIVRALVEELEERGHDGSQFLRTLDLESARLHDATELVDVETYARAVDLALAQTKDARLGLAVGSRVAASTVHVVHHAVLACRNLREAWDCFARFSPLLLTRGRFELRERAGVSALIFEHPAMPPHLAVYDAECIASMIAHVIRELVPGITSRDCAIHFRHAEPADLAPYRREFDVDVRFSCDENALLGDAALLDDRQRHSDPVLSDLLKRHAEQMLGALNPEKRIPARIRHLVRASDRPAAIEAADVAQELGLTVHTLRRQLRREGQSVRGLVEEAMRELACSLLENAESPIKEIAYQLGFSEPSAFHRAFKRWTGLTPAEFRAGKTAEPSPDEEDSEPPDEEDSERRFAARFGFLG